MKKGKVLLTGGTGLIGNFLCRRLLYEGYQVACLTRGNHVMDGVETYKWDVSKHELKQEVLTDIDYVIHLAGANIGESRWTASRKKVIVDSRIQPVNLLFGQIQLYQVPLKAFISASATGYYGMVTTNRIFEETDPHAYDYLGETCHSWENAADRFQEAGIRTVKIRTGVVFTPKGGALARIALPVRLGIGAPLGTGKQYMPWIHIDDLCGIYIKALEDKAMEGAFNAVAPEHITNCQLTKAIAGVLLKPFWFPPVPSFALHLLFGEMASMLLTGSRVSCNKIIHSGYDFKYSLVNDALNHLLGNSL
ncbi:MAG: TIGR01777 family oxidoreductase [Bacteroidales bacterium]|nr:TIGR01777 family oxidoreductase [Bacteroidales bacterium]